MLSIATWVLLPSRCVQDYFTNKVYPLGRNGSQCDGTQRLAAIIFNMAAYALQSDRRPFPFVLQSWLKPLKIDIYTRIDSKLDAFHQTIRIAESEE